VTVTVSYPDLVAFAADVFARTGLPPARARTAAEALCYGDLTGMTSHGLVNLVRLYLPLFEHGRAVPDAEPVVLADRGAAALIDGARGLGLWLAAEAMDGAVRRAAEYGVGLVSVRNATHFGCAGFHALRAVDRQMVGLVAANCGRQRIARPPGARPALLGTNPFSLAAPAGDRYPFVLDMSTTVVPTGRIRAAACAGEPVPPGWLEDRDGRPVTDAGAFDRREAYLRWLGGDALTGAFKGFGLALLVEVLAAVVPGAGLGPQPEALDGDGGPTGRDDDIGLLAVAIAPGVLRPVAGFLADADAVFGAVLAAPPLRTGDPVRYPGWWEGDRSARRRVDGVPLADGLYDELHGVADRLGAVPPRRTDGAR
jgi:LDH2 family malate/lactate/ureidoglycolate dehydrogenase